MKNVYLHFALLGLASATSLAGEVPQESRGVAYSPVGKRDPFRPPAAEQGRDPSSVNPLEKHGVDKFQLKAILKGMGRPRAMFEDPDGRSFILSEGDTFGRERGTISRILNTEVIVTERTFNYLGAENLYERVLSLPPADAVNEVDGGNRGASGGGSGGGRAAAVTSTPVAPARSAAASAPARSAPSVPIGNSANITTQGGNVR